MDARSIPRLISRGNTMANSETTNATLLSLTQSIAIFTAVLPSFAEVRKSINDPAMVQDVRVGEAVASALVITIGVTASSMTKSEIPAIVSIASALALVAMYEKTLRTTPKEYA